MIRRARRHEADPLRTVAIGALAVLAALACIAFASPAAAAPAPPSTPSTPATRPAADAAPRYGLVLQDAAPLRSGPKSGGAPLAALGQGALVEIRGTRMDYLQVWDTARERGGYVRASSVRPLSLTPDEAPELLAVVRFLKDRPGSEALGLGFAAAYLRAAPAGSLGAEAFDALGTMAERLAWRANVAGAKAANLPTAPGEPAIAAQLQVAADLGIHFDALERDGGVRLCYDGDAFRHVFALSPTPEQQARAALALTRPDCQPTTLAPMLRWQADQGRAATLARVAQRDLAPYWRNRLRMREAGVWAALAFEDSRRLVVEAGAAPPAGLPAVTADDVLRAGNAALAALAAVDKSELADDDQSTYADAAMRVGASRWAAEAAPVAASAAPAALGVVTQPGQPGETCVLLVDAKHPGASPLARRCTYGTVWAASARANARGDALALAVQPLAGWRELWVFRRGADGWAAQVLPPAADPAELGYVEFAGWVPATAHLLVAREVRDPQHAARTLRSYELVDPATLATLHQAASPAGLSPFQRWQDPGWKRVTVSLR